MEKKLTSSVDISSRISIVSRAALRLGSSAGILCVFCLVFAGVCVVLRLYVGVRKVRWGAGEWGGCAFYLISGQIANLKGSSHVTPHDT